MKKEIKIEFSNFKIISLIVVLLLIGAGLLISSGIFDIPEVNNQEHNHTNITQNPSVNLNVINEINRLEEIVKNNPANHEALLNLGHLLNDNGFHQKAISKYETYLNTHPENTDVIVDMGVCYFELKNYNKAIEVIKSALDIDPKHQIANFNLGIVNFANNNITEARKYWQKAKEINPNSNIGKKAEELLKSNN